MRQEKTYFQGDWISKVPRKYKEDTSDYYEDNQTQITSGEENQSTVDGSKDSATNNSSKSSNKNNSKTNSTKKPPLRPTRILKFPAA